MLFKIELMPLTLSELAIHLPASIRLFEKYRLDYYRNGKQTLRAACDEKGLPFEIIDAELSALKETPGTPYAYTLEDMSTDRLIDFVNGRYHANEERLLASIGSGICRLSEDPACSVPLLPQLADDFAILRAQLLMHCKKENELLFPIMRKLANTHKTQRISPADVHAVRRSIHQLRDEHARIAELLTAVREASDRFSVPAGAPPDYAALMEDLELFEQDMHMHLHIENNVLFPRLLALVNSPANE